MHFVAADEACVGMQREDGSYDFDLPGAVTLNVQDDACDAEWTIDVNIKTYFSYVRPIWNFILFLIEKLNFKI